MGLLATFEKERESRVENFIHKFYPFTFSCGEIKNYIGTKK